MGSDKVGRFFETQCTRIIMEKNLLKLSEAGTRLIAVTVAGGKEE